MAYSHRRCLLSIQFVNGEKQGMIHILPTPETAASPRKPCPKDDDSQSGALDGSLSKHILDDVDPFDTFESFGDVPVLFPTPLSM